MSSKLRTILVILALVLIAAAVAFYSLDPDAQLKGVIAGEPKYDGRTASAWIRDLSGGDENSRTQTAEKLKADGGRRRARAGGRPEGRADGGPAAGKLPRRHGHL